MIRASLTFAALALALLALSWAPGSSQPASAGAPAPDLSIAVEGFNCDTKGVNPLTCQVPPGVQFTVVVSINDLAGLVDGDDPDSEPGYVTFQARLDYSAGLTLKNRTAVSEVVWDDCNTPAELKDPGSYLAGCAIAGGANGSTFTGALVEVDFNCSTESPQTVTLVHGLPSMASPIGDSLVVDENGAALAASGSEELTITCAQGVGGVAEQPDVARTPLDAADSTGRDYGVWVGLAALLAAGGAVMAGAAWFARRRRV